MLKRSAVLNCRACMGQGHTISSRKGRVKCHAEGCDKGRVPVGAVFALWCINWDFGGRVWGHKIPAVMRQRQRDEEAWRSTREASDGDE